jgi:hypothetical protein
VTVHEKGIRSDGLTSKKPKWATLRSDEISTAFDENFALVSCFKFNQAFTTSPQSETQTELQSQRKLSKALPTKALSRNALNLDQSYPVVEWHELALKLNIKV